LQFSQEQAFADGKNLVTYSVRHCVNGDAIFGRLFVKRFALCYRTAVMSVCLSVCLSVYLSVCDVRALWPSGRMDQDETWHAGIGLGPGHTVLDGDSAHPLPKGHTPNFRPISVAAKWLDESRCHLVLRYASAQATVCWMGTPLYPP